MNENAEPEPDFPSGIALVVGGSGGIGAAVVAALARSGSHVALTYHRNRAGGEAAAERERREVEQERREVERERREAEH